MRHEFALTVERSEGTWVIELTDEQGQGVRRRYGLSLAYALMDAISYVASKDYAEDEPVHLAGSHP